MSAHTSFFAPVGEEGLFAFQQILGEAERQLIGCAGILLLSRDHADWAERIVPSPRTAVLVQPVTMKQLSTKLAELIAAK